MGKTVYVGMSGGVDSSVTAALLKQQGYNVVGVYMKNWTKDLPGMVCPWKDDYQDAKRVAVQLGIDFKVFDFQTQYRRSVVDYMVGEYQSGRTPNPDIMCNQEVKFKLFLNTALEDGADMIATGHYARTHSPSELCERINLAQAHPTPVNVKGSTFHKAQRGFGDGVLRVAANADKDQTYFLYRVTSEALSKTLMPIGDFTTKAEVRELARKFGLSTADKKDSQGICFVGKVGIRDFLESELGPQLPGAIIDQNGAEIGQHDGAIFYTIGQRHGLSVGGGLPYYVTSKDMQKNEVYVTTQLDDDRLWHSSVKLTDMHWINPNLPIPADIKVRLRYRAPLVDCSLNGNIITLKDPVRAVTPGQSAVFYHGDSVLGGGIVV